MIQKVVGIVLHVLKYKDTSNIVTLYTDLHGRASYLVPVSRAKKRGVQGLLFQPLAVIEFEEEHRSGKSMQRIHEAKLQRVNTSIPLDPCKSAIALFLAEFLYRALREETGNETLFAYLTNSIQWLDMGERGMANFHLVFLMRFSRFLGLYPNLDDYREGDYFDLLNACFCHSSPLHRNYLMPEEATRIVLLMRMNYETMYLFEMNRAERGRCLEVLNEYYKLHLPDFPTLKSLEVLKELFS